eukprot:jgi/Tetstr1/454013/TSEL_040932.t1
MLCFVEGDWRTYAGKEASDRVRMTALEDNQWFREWVAANAHNIPKRYGGIGEDHSTVWNTKASLWFRKAASWVGAYEAAPRDTIVVWIDSDVLITGALDAGLFDKALRGHDIGYVCGLSRKKHKGVETGVFALRKNPRTDAFVSEYKATFDRSAAEWGLLERWDDGFVFKWVLERSSVPPGSFFASEHHLTGGARCVDWARKDNKDPMTASCLASRFVHQKGLHRGVGADELGSDPRHADRTARYMAVRKRL